MLSLGLAAFGLAALGITAGAQAQLMPLFGSDGPFLNREDFVQADAAARVLLEPQPAPLGTFARWSDPASGNSGVLTMGRAYSKSGYDCRTVSWRDIFKGGIERTVLLETCRVGGAWKLV